MPVSEGGAKYFIVMTDDFSRYRKTAVLKQKDEAEQAIKEFISEIEAKGHRMEAIRKDEGTEFGSKNFEKWLREKGIQINDSAPYTPEQNGVSERAVDLVCEKARSMLLATDLSESLWAEAVMTATYLMNRSPTRSLARGQTPFEAFHGKKPPIHHIRIFGCTAYSQIPKQKIRGKMEPRSKKMRMVGYESTNIYRLWDPVERRVTLTRDAVFNENELQASEEKAACLQPSETAERVESDETLSDIAKEALNLLDFEAMEEEASVAASVRSAELDSSCPRSYAQAKRSYASAQWQAAMEKQMEALTTNETWNVVGLESLPSGAKVLSGKWVYTEKEQEDEKKIQKTRWVVRGFEQKEENIDWDDLTAATVRAQTMRILFAMAVEENWDVQQMDAVAVFLNGEIKDEVFVEMPMGWRERGKICKLKKTLYGLKTSPAI